MTRAALDSASARALAMRLSSPSAAWRSRASSSALRSSLTRACTPCSAMRSLSMRERSSEVTSAAFAWRWRSACFSLS
jgi:hypothetical protein